MYKKPQQPALSDLVSSIMTKPSINIAKAYEELVGDMEKKDVNDVEQQKPQTPENNLGLL